jgi:predicted DNA binding CopG/RHH family protein
LLSGVIYIRHTMQRVSVFLSEKQIAALKKLAKRAGLSYAEILRRAIDQYVKEQR